MTGDLPTQLALRFSVISLLSIGGAVAALPEAQRQIVEQAHWLTGAEFSQTFALAQAAPGPNVIVFSMIGWRLAGWTGLAAATLGILAPSSLLALAVSRFLRHISDSQWLALFNRALAPIAIGLMGASGYLLARGVDTDALGLVITAAAAAMVYFTRRNPLTAVAGGAAVFVVARHLSFY